MPHRRHTVTVATSALFFVCLMLHAQTNLYSQTLLPYSNPEAYEFASSEDLQAFFKPDGAGWEGLAKRYPDSAHSYIVLSPVAFNADKTIAVVYVGHSCGSLCGGGTVHVLENKDGIWKNMRWRGTSCAWAS